MKYLLPRRVGSITVSSNATWPDGPRVLCPLIIGDEMAYKPYFHQVTNGLPINDVIHSKYVGSDGDMFDVPDFDVRHDRWLYSYRGNKGCYYPGTCRYIKCIATSKGSCLATVWYNWTGSPDPVIGYGYRLTYLQVSILTARVYDWNRRYYYISDVDFTARLRSRDFRVSRARGTTQYQVDDIIMLGDIPTFCSEDEWLERFELYSTLALTRAKALLEERVGYGSPVSEWSWSEEVSIEPLKDYPSDFLFQEPERIGNKTDPLLLGNGLENNGYWFNWLVQHSYVDALQQLPKMNDNNLANILSIVSFIKGLVVDHRIEIPSSLQDAWLQYRYVAKTSALDIEESIRFMNRYYPVAGLGIKSYGTAVHEVDNSLVRCRCQLEIKSRELGTLDKIWNALYTYGLQPNFYVVWDSIPFSFIVDWFLPVGDIASNVDLLNHYSSQNYEINGVTYSLEYVREHDDGPNVHCYSRWLGEPLRTVNNFYWFDRPSTSSKVKLYRVLDAASLAVS